MARIALVEDDPAVRSVFVRMLESADHRPAVFESGDAFLLSGAAGSFDVVVTDLQMAGATGLDVLKACRAESDPPEVLLVTGYGSIQSAVEAMRLGAFDYLAKPVQSKELLHRVDVALEARRLRKQVSALTGEVRRRHGLAPPIGNSPVMREFLARARKAAETSSTVLILGETGTGKDVIARQIQSTGPRADGPYLTLNCAAIPENLLESELFGHARGAFSGATELKRGLFEEASGGTLFLDEVAAMSVAAQAKLLRVLEDGAVRRVGENKPIRVDVRILAATNRNLAAAMAAGDFREDLFYRLSVVTLVVPPLRERPEDIEPLARHFLAESARRHGKERVFAPETLEHLRRYDFPGNVRELRYAIEQAVILSADKMLKPEDFPFRPHRPEAARVGHAPARLRPSQEIDAEKLQEALRQCGGNRMQAARILGISRATLYRLLARDDSRDSKKDGGSGEP
jgi:two-component system response regulator HydG